MPQVLTSSPVTSRANQAYSALTGVTGLTAFNDSPASYSEIEVFQNAFLQNLFQPVR